MTSPGSAATRSAILSRRYPLTVDLVLQSSAPGARPVVYVAPTSRLEGAGAASFGDDRFAAASDYLFNERTGFRGALAALGPRTSSPNAGEREEVHHDIRWNRLCRPVDSPGGEEFGPELAAPAQQSPLLRELWISARWPARPRAPTRIDSKSKNAATAATGRGRRGRMHLCAQAGRARATMPPLSALRMELL